MFLDVAKVVGHRHPHREPAARPATGPVVVSLDFTSEGQKKWPALTREAFTPASGDTCLPAAQALSQGATHCPRRGGPGQGGHLGAGIQGRADRTVADHRQFTATDRPRCSPTRSSTARCGHVQPRPDPDVSATLGVQQLKAGLLAAADRQVLVAIYAFFYYGARYGHLPEPDPVRPADVRCPGVPGRATGFTLSLRA
jgi:preprotein translocase subunit SecD